MRNYDEEYRMQIIYRTILCLMIMGIIAEAVVVYLSYTL